uniref:(California timema) hypothetical protein n=1 Tax=Timema californicum TaxID=61474 RepID=A0A7R9PCK4_TIMCA|nr:unnamed protein product [Timema californicum]
MKEVWDLSVKPTLEYVVPTIASVGFIKWRPQRKFHIASCALVVDCGVNVWDVRRPYIPYAAFTEHKDVATGVAWRGDPHVFLSTSRDHTLYHHVFQDATRPADKANPQGIALSCRMDVSHAYRVHGTFGQTKTLFNTCTREHSGKQRHCSTPMPGNIRTNKDIVQHLYQGTFGQTKTLFNTSTREHSRNKDIVQHLYQGTFGQTKTLFNTSTREHSRNKDIVQHLYQGTFGQTKTLLNTCTRERLSKQRHCSTPVPGNIRETKTLFNTCTRERLGKQRHCSTPVPGNVRETKTLFNTRARERLVKQRHCLTSVPGNVWANKDCQGSFGQTKKVPTHNEKFYHSSSLMHRFTTKNSREVHNIEECARRYIIAGRPLPEMCDHNAAVAKDMGRNQRSCEIGSLAVCRLCCMVDVNK